MLKGDRKRYKNCIRCGIDNNITITPYCYDCRRSINVEVDTRNRLRFEKREELYNFIWCIDVIQKGMATERQVFVDLIGWFNLYGKTTGLINHLSTSDQILFMWEFLKEENKKNN